MISAHGGLELDGNVDEAECQRAFPDCSHSCSPPVELTINKGHGSKSNAACGKQFCDTRDAKKPLERGFFLGSRLIN
jgi:hypothetical protein